MKADFESLRVVPFSKDEYTPSDFSGPPLFTWREYYSFRNDVLRVLMFYGTVGPMGETPVLSDWEASEDAWQVGTLDPDFFVINDMWNEYDRWSPVDAAPGLVTAQLLRDLIAMVQRWPGWRVHIGLEQGGLTVLSDRILYEGELFAGASSIEELGKRCGIAQK
jgi:hypothetical protein